MYKKYINIFLVASLTLCFMSCEDMLEEHPKSTITPEFFSTTLGMQSGVIAAYSGLRSIHGTDGSVSNLNIGTDEFMSTDQLGGATSCDTYDKDFSPSNGTPAGPWGTCLQYINTCNGVIDYASTTTPVGLTEAIRKQLLAEAHFLRAYYYYQLTMYYGAAPLDLGSGKLKFNLTPVTTSVRDSRADVLAAVIADFKYAKDSLAIKPSATGRATKAAAIHFLAKAYLSRASFGLGNVSADYKQAYDEAMELINNQSTYNTSLTQDFATVNVEGHENDPEVLFNVQRTWTASGPNMQFEESNDGSYAVANKGNRSNFFFTAGYENVKWPVANAKVVPEVKAGPAIVPRSIPYQRPWRMIMPTKWLVFTAFADKVNDSRWDNSFRTSWNAGVQFTVKGRTVNVGDTAIKISLNQIETAGPADTLVDLLDNKKNVVAHVIYKPYALYWWGELYNTDGTYKLGNVQYIYPNLKKFDDTKRQNMNYDSNRPLILARLAETYLIAAEAIMYTDKAEAARLINVVRERAAYRSNLSAADLAIRKSAMDITAKDVTIDFILDERSREICGEGWRWYDLVRTGKLLERARLYNYKAAPNISEKHLLHPIPQSQIDLLSDPAQKAIYQNPGY